MSDRIVLANMRFEGRHGVHDGAARQPQPFEVDVELVLDLRPAGVDDDLGEDRRLRPGLRDRAGGSSRRASFQLLEAIAEAIADDAAGRRPGRRGRRPRPQAGGPARRPARPRRRRDPAAPAADAEPASARGAGVGLEVRRARPEGDVERMVLAVAEHGRR